MALISWLDAANDPATDFPLENLPYGVFRESGRTRIGIAIGDQVLDLHACAVAGMLSSLPGTIATACRAEALNPLMALGPEAWASLRNAITALLDAVQADVPTRQRVSALLVPMSGAQMQLPAQIGDYTDFYASIHHATRVGRLFRPDQPLLPNYRYIPIGYHGRASSIVISGTEVQRPPGQFRERDGTIHFAPTRSLDFEAEIGAFVGTGNRLGESISIAEAEQHIFGLCLVNDWSARDLQAWEAQPLGPFLAKNFATTISPWIVPLPALAPYRVAVAPRAAGDPEPLEYLANPMTDLYGFDVLVEVLLQTRLMRENGVPPQRISRSNLRDLYWTIAQLLTHHASNGCNLRPGDLLATGTISGAEAGSEGCLLERQLGAGAILLPSGETRTWLEDGDTIVLRASAERPGKRRIGFGACTGIVVSRAVAYRHGQG